jgi:hypothetical protein
VPPSVLRRIFTGIIDVSEAASEEGAIPAMLYQNGSDPTWRSVDAVLQGPVTGFVRYTVELWEGMPNPGMSGTSIGRTQAKVIPYLRLREGGRLFDHNGVSDPFGTYLLSGQSGLQLETSPELCRAPPPRPQPQVGATLSFNRDGTIQTSGAVTAPSQLTLIYDPERLPSCRATHNGYPAWDLLAHVRLLPSGRMVSGTVREFIFNLGQPTNQVKAAPFRFEVPLGTTRIELWFENYSGAGNFCRTWDSNQSRNYSFPVQQPVGWLGNPVVSISRGDFGPCEGGPLGQGFTFGTWARQRAAITNLCFEVWQPGITDRENANLWREISAQVHYRYAPTEPFQSAYVNVQQQQVGNNARYAINLRNLDPFATYHCTTAPFTTPADSQYDQATMEFFLTANGVPLTQPGGAPFVGVFQDYPGTHDTYCPK